MLLKDPSTFNFFLPKKVAMSVLSGFREAKKNQCEKMNMTPFWV